MAESTHPDWRRRLDAVNYAFQPIVNIHTGVCYGYEALLRQVPDAGFDTIADFFDQAHRDRLLPMVHRRLFAKAIHQFEQILWHRRTCLFYNLDNRLFACDGYDAADLQKGLGCDSISTFKVCYEISEQHEIVRPQALIDRLTFFRDTGCRIAVDDFGVGVSGLRLLYYSRPDYIKIDRFFIHRIAEDSEKRMLAGFIVSIAHQMGSIVIAEGVETEAELYECRRIGCDMVQGYLVQKPQLQCERLQKSYLRIRQCSEKDRRNPTGKDVSLLQAEIEPIDPLDSDAPLTDILDAFKNHIQRTFFPVVNRKGEPLGIIREASIKSFIYSRYGRFVLENQSFSKRLAQFITRIPQVDIHMPIDHIMDLFSGNERFEGILVTRNLKYVGFLSNRSMLKILNERKLSLARDQNPLTKLPGNNAIFEYVSQSLRDISSRYALVYFDFDNFKAYNDHYGFRQGDRVILLFSELLKSHTMSRDRFVGHVGGDDFFMGFKDVDLDDVDEEVRGIAGQFRSSVESFYQKSAVDAQCITARDRDGRMRSFPLMTVSSAILELPAQVNRIYSPEEIGTFIANMKKEAKQSPEKRAVASLVHFRHEDHQERPDLPLTGTHPV